jgi:hypothetical protein
VPAIPGRPAASRAIGNAPRLRAGAQSPALQSVRRPVDAGKEHPGAAHRGRPVILARANKLLRRQHAIARASPCSKHAPRPPPLFDAERWDVVKENVNAMPGELPRVFLWDARSDWKAAMPSHTCESWPRQATLYRSVTSGSCWAATCRSFAYEAYSSERRPLRHRREAFTGLTLPQPPPSAPDRAERATRSHRPLHPPRRAAQWPATAIGSATRSP